MAFVLSYDVPAPASAPSFPEERLLAHLLRNAASNAGEAFKSLGGSHPVDLLMSKDAYELRADAPGLSAEDMAVEVHEGVLTITAGAPPKPEPKPASKQQLQQQPATGDAKAAGTAAAAATGSPAAGVDGGWRLVRRERANGGQRWARAFLLPENADADAISVRLDRGVLTVHVPLRPPPPRPAPRRIAVSSGPEEAAVKRTSSAGEQRMGGNSH